MSYKYWYSIVWHIQSGTHCAAGYISKWFPPQNMSLYYTTTMLMFFVIHFNILNVPDIHRNIKASTLWWCGCQRKKGHHDDILFHCYVFRTSCIVCVYAGLFPHDDVIKWKNFPRNWPFVREIHRSPVNFPHKGQWRGALMFSLIYVWINDWVNNREAGDLRRQHGHYDVIVMPNAIGVALQNICPVPIRMFIRRC